MIWDSPDSAKGEALEVHLRGVSLTVTGHMGGRGVYSGYGCKPGICDARKAVTSQNSIPRPVMDSAFRNSFISKQMHLFPQIIKIPFLRTYEGGDCVIPQSCLFCLGSV